MDRTISNRLHDEASHHLVGGVNSPVRAFKSVHGTPIYFQKASGAVVVDVDGNELVDFIQSWGPLIHGHSHPQIIGAVTEKMQNGTSFGAPHTGELELAKKVKTRFPFMDKVRFVSSGKALPRKPAFDFTSRCSVESRRQSLQLNRRCEVFI